MKSPIKLIAKRLGAICVLLFFAFTSYGSHIFGVDLYYTHVTGDTYTINLVVYGDCSGAAFSTLSGSTPVVNVYNGGTLFTSVTLAIQAPTSGTQVSPVCAADAGNTTCNNPSSTIPGITKFVYSSNVTLSGPSTVWRFLFQGVMGGGEMAGRSNSITNIVVPGTGSVIQLVDTLNNDPYINSNPEYTAIATPFFCIDVPSNYNPGAVDPDGDALTFALVDAIDASTGGSVTYNAPYTGAAPLAVTAGTFTFNSTNGQLSFTPNAVQRSLVVYNVEEHRGGVLVGTSQREMSFLVLSPCSSIPPTGNISSPTAGTVVGSTELDVCANVGAFRFQIDPIDAGLDTIVMSVTGLPTGATFNIVNNNTTAPQGTFSWNTTGVAPGIYTFYVSYIGKSCPLNSTQTLAYTVFVMAVPAEFVDVLSEPTCTREAQYLLLPSGGPSPWSVDVMTGSTSLYTVPSITTTLTDSVPSGTYTFRIYNAYGCYTDTTITFTAPTLPTPVVTVAAPLCVGGSTGSATITGTRGTAPYTYALGISGFGTSGVFTGLASGTYTLYVKDAHGCLKDTVINIPAATPILEHIHITKPLCNNYADGTIVVQAYNTVAPYTYALGSGSYTTTDSFSNLASGSYVIHIIDGNGCNADTTISLTDSTNIHGRLSIIAVPCYGDSASVLILPTGGYPPYNYAYNSGAPGSSDLFTLPAGTYTIQVTDAESCFFDTTITLTQPSPGVISPLVTNVLCYDTYTGSVIVDVTGGTAPYEYDTLGGTFTTSATVTGLDAGMHIIQVRDANGCFYNDTINLTQPTPLEIDSVLSQEPACHGGVDGTFTIYATGGTPGYTYAQDAGSFSSGSTITALAAGTYTLYVKDANGCTHDTVVTLSQPPAISASALVIAATCNGIANGAAVMTASGGTPGYTFAIDGSTYGIVDSFGSLAAGPHLLAVKDARGCIFDTTVNVRDSLHISGIFTITPAVCYNTNTGTIIVNGTGGAVPYSYDIDGAPYSAANLFGGLAAGSYTIGITDANGCIQDTSVAVTQPANLGLSLAITEPSCFGYSNGSFTVSPYGGTPFYTFNFNGGGFVSATVFTGLAALTDNIEVKDANGCTYDTSFTIQQPTQLVITGETVTNVSCYGGANGTITVNADGGTPGYLYQANSAGYQTSNVLTGLVAGVQTIYVEDTHNCITEADVTVTQPAPLVWLSADTVDPTCQGYRDGSVTLNVAGGTMPYQYSINNVNFSSAPLFDSLAEGSYTFFVKDSNGCESDTSLTLVGYPHILYDSIIITPPLCVGYGDGAVSVYGSGGVEPLTYSLSGSNTFLPPATFDSLYAGPYVVTITDSKQCFKDSSIAVPQPDSIVIVLNIKPNECLGTTLNGAITAQVTGGTPPYLYMWSNVGSFSDNTTITGLQNGVYSVAVTDAHSCADSTSGVVKYDDCCTPFIPTAFTPNKDGKDDVFGIEYKGDMTIITFEIFNRFGERVFQTFHQYAEWDGTFLGQPCDVGTYYYYAKIICGNGGDHILELKGDVTLLR